MFMIAFKGFGSCTRGKTLWQIACRSLVMVCLTREMQGFWRIKRELISLLFLFEGLMYPCI